MGAVVDHFYDGHGLLWPSVVAPFQVIVIPGPGFEDDASMIYDRLVGFSDVVIDDRPLSLGWKMKDADLVGYPVVILVANKWRDHRLCEMRCRYTAMQRDVSLDEIHDITADVLSEC
jgi:prolyl-tRNA synthetase